MHKKKIPVKTISQRWYEDDNPDNIYNSHKQVKVRLPSGEKIFVDCKMKPILQKIWNKGYLTSFSCQGGHNHGWDLYQHLGSSPDGHSSKAQLLFTLEREQLAFYLTFQEKFPEKVNQIKLFHVANPGMDFPKELLPYISSTSNSLLDLKSAEVTELIRNHITSSEYLFPQFPEFPAYNEFRELRNAAYPEHTDPPLEDYPVSLAVEKIVKKKPNGLVPLYVFMGY